MTSFGQPTIQLQDPLLADLPLRDAAQLAARRGADFFPSRAALNAASRSEHYLRTLSQRLRAGYTPTRADVVPVPKFGGGTRPAADLGVSDRILFDALVRSIESRLPADVVNRSLVGDDRAKVEDELREGPHAYVLVTDVVAFYEYIDRDRLVSELLDLTGEDELVTAIGALLDALVGKTLGIPQASPEATTLGDVYLSIADRELARAGVDVARWGDDYRIPADDLTTAYRHLGHLEQALRQIGLVLNAGKTWTPGVEKYGAWIDQQRATRDMVRRLRIRIQERIAAEYAEDVDEPVVRPRRSVDRTLERGFVKALEEAPWGSSPEGYAASRRIRTSLQELGRSGSSAPLERLAALLTRYPYLTRDIAQYLKRRIAGGRVDDTVELTAESLTSEAYPYEWQAGWLVHALIPVEVSLPESVVTWCRRVVTETSVPGFIRGRAAILLATEGELPVHELDSLWHDFPVANRGDLVAAATLLDDARVDRFLGATRRDPLYAAIADEAPTTHVYQL